MRHFVRIEAPGGTNVLGGLGENCSVGQSGKRRVLHSTGGEILDRYLIVFGPREVDPDLAFEELHNVRRVAKRVRRMFRERWLRVKAKRDVSVLLLQSFQVARDEAYQVIDMRFFV